VVEVILDTNVLFSSLRNTPRSQPVMVMRSLLDGRHSPLLSEELLEEYRQVLNRPRALAWHGWSPATVAELVAALRLIGRVVPLGVGPACPDLRDQHLWDLLATEPASTLVTGERALLQGDQFPGRVLSPRQLFEQYLSA
jgi:predicted nucleic acid-binding protein